MFIFIFDQVNGVLTERTVGEVLPLVSQNYEGVLYTHLMVRSFKIHSENFIDCSDIVYAEL